MTAKKWARAAAALLLSGMLLCTAGCATLSAVLKNSRTEPTAAPTPAPTAEPSAEPTAAPTVEPTPEATAAPAPLTEAALLADIDEAASFFCDWFYDRSAVIAPAYSDFTEYPPYSEDGTPMVYPTAVADIPDRAALLAAAERYFEHGTAEALLADIFAQDVDGRLCVSKSEGLGGPGYYVSLTVTGSGDGSYTIRMNSGIPHTDYGFDPIYVQYTPGSETAVFGGDRDTIQSFFITHLYTAERTVTIE